MTCDTCGRPTKDYYYGNNLLLISLCEDCGKDDVLGCTCKPVEGFKPDIAFLQAQRNYIEKLNAVLGDNHG